MKILFITYENPLNLISGDNIYTWDILSSLKDENAEIDLLSYDQNYDNAYLSKLRSYCNKIFIVPFKHKSKARLTLSLYPAPITNRKSKKLINNYLSVLNSEYYDFVFINHFKLSFLVEYLPIQIHRPKFVLITHNNETKLAWSLYKNTNYRFFKLLYLWEYIKVYFKENQYLKKFDILTAISDMDADDFKNQYTLSKIFLLSPKVKLLENILNNDRSRVVILCGSFKWLPKKENLLRFVNCSNFHKLIENRIRLLVVGNVDHELVVKVNKIDGVEMTGFVKDTYEYYKQARVAVVPELLGGGFKLKIAEAVTHRLPIVAINNSVTDYEMINGKHYLGGDTFEELVENIILTINNPSLCDLLVDNCINLFERKYSSSQMHYNLSNILSL